MIIMLKLLKISVLLLMFALPLIPASNVTSQTSTSVPYPKIDGFWSLGEWPSSIIQTYTFNNQLQVQFAYRVNSTDIFMTARYQDLTPSFYGGKCYSNVYTNCSDGFAVGFDNNGDHQNMGSKASPDDTIFVGIEGNYSIDAYMQGINSKIVYDTEVGGVNNTFGRFSYNTTDHYFTYEMTKKLDSGDTLGHDIALHQGSTIDVMLAYWDNLPARTEITGYSPWIKITIQDPFPAIPSSNQSVIASSNRFDTMVVPLLIAFIGVLVIGVVSYGVGKVFKFL